MGQMHWFSEGDKRSCNLHHVSYQCQNKLSFLQRKRSQVLKIISSLPLGLVLSQLCLYFNFSVKEPQNYKTPLLQLCTDTQACTISAWSCLLYPNYPFTVKIHERSVSRASMSDDLHGGLSLAQCTVNLLLSHPKPLVIDATVMLLFSQSLVCGSLMSK